MEKKRRPQRLAQLQTPNLDRCRINRPLHRLRQPRPRQNTGIHHHKDDAEFYYVLEGRAKVTVEDEQIDSTPGTVIYIPVAAKHSIFNDGKTKFVFLYGLNADTRRYTYDITVDQV